MTIVAVDVVAMIIVGFVGFGIVFSRRRIVVRHSVRVRGMDQETEDHGERKQDRG